MSAPQKRYVKCPYCGQDSLFSPENSFRPFCSERCQLQDLGMWANEDFRIPVEGESLQDLILDDESQSENES